MLFKADRCARVTQQDEEVGRTSRQIEYRGFEVCVTASFRFGGIFVSARLTGGPHGLARHFGLPSAETSVTRACDVAIEDIRALIDRLLAPSPGLPGSTGE